MNLSVIEKYPVVHYIFNKVTNSKSLENILKDFDKLPDFSSIEYNSCNPNLFLFLDSINQELFDAVDKDIVKIRNNDLYYIEMDKESRDNIKNNVILYINTIIKFVKLCCIFTNKKSKDELVRLILSRLKSAMPKVIKDAIKISIIDKEDNMKISKLKKFVKKANYYDMIGNHKAADKIDKYISKFAEPTSVPMPKVKTRTSKTGIPKTESQYVYTMMRRDLEAAGRQYLDYLVYTGRRQNRTAPLSIGVPKYLEGIKSGRYRTEEQLRQEYKSYIAKFRQDKIDQIEEGTEANYAERINKFNKFIEKHSKGNTSGTSEQDTSQDQGTIQEQSAPQSTSSDGIRKLKGSCDIKWADVLEVHVKDADSVDDSIVYFKLKIKNVSEKLDGKIFEFTPKDGVKFTNTLSDYKERGCLTKLNTLEDSTPERYRAEGMGEEMSLSQISKKLLEQKFNAEPGSVFFSDPSGANPRKPIYYQEPDGTIYSIYLTDDAEPGEDVEGYTVVGDTLKDDKGNTVGKKITKFTKFTK